MAVCETTEDVDELLSELEMRSIKRTRYIQPVGRGSCTLSRMRRKARSRVYGRGVRLPLGDISEVGRVARCQMNYYQS